MVFMRGGVQDSEKKDVTKGKRRLNANPRMTTRYLVLTAFFVALTAVGAKIEIPLPYVPFTLQTFFVLLAGMLLGSRFGALSQIMYVVVGLAGVPVFARGGGVRYVLEPTFGYLLGFIPAAYVAGILIEKRLPIKFPQLLVASFCGLAVIYLFGLMYLYVYTHFLGGKDLNLFEILKGGLLVFLPVALAKAFLAAVVVREVRRRLP